MPNDDFSAVRLDFKDVGDPLGERPASLRMRLLLKNALRALGFKCVGLTGGATNCTGICTDNGDKPQKTLNS